MKNFLWVFVGCWMIFLFGCESSDAKMTGEDTSSASDNGTDNTGDDDDDNNNDDNDNDTNGDDDDDIINDDDDDDDDTGGGVDCIDNDGDWWCIPRDCNDDDPNIHPNTPEIDGNNIDDDCDGKTDEVLDTDESTDTEIVIIDMDCSECNGVGSTLDAMVCAIDLCDSEYVVSTEYTTETPMVQTSTVGCELEDTWEAVAHFGDTSNELAPKLNESYAMMGTGPVLDVPDYGTACSEVSAGPDPFVFEMDEDLINEVERYDMVNWSITLKTPSEANAFQFKYVFFSTEYDEMVSSPYNDKFYAIIESPGTNGGEPTVINYTSCRVPDKKWDFICDDDIADDFGCIVGEKYCYVAVNSAFSDCCWYPNGSEWADNNTDFPCYGETPEDTTDISGTGFECAGNNVADFETHGGSSTGWIQTIWPVRPNSEFKITFHLHDAHEQFLDSQVIIDAFQFLKTDQQGTIIVIE